MLLHLHVEIGLAVMLFRIGYLFIYFWCLVLGYRSHLLCVPVEYASQKI